MGRRVPVGVVGMKGMGSRLGHSYWRPRRPMWVKLEVWVQVVRLGEV